jgi:hypothetical protein
MNHLQDSRIRKLTDPSSAVPPTTHEISPLTSDRPARVLLIMEQDSFLCAGDATSDRKPVPSCPGCKSKLKKVGEFSLEKRYVQETEFIGVR